MVWQAAAGAACACAGRRTGAGRQGGKHAFRQAWQRGMAGANTAITCRQAGNRQAGRQASIPALTPFTLLQMGTQKERRVQMFYMFYCELV